MNLDLTDARGQTAEALAIRSDHPRHAAMIVAEVRSVRRPQHEHSARASALNVVRRLMLRGGVQRQYRQRWRGLRETWVGLVVYIGKVFEDEGCGYAYTVPAYSSGHSPKRHPSCQ